MKKKNNIQDTDLREAIRRTEGRQPQGQPGANFTASVMQKVMADEKVYTNRPYRLYVQPFSSIRVRRIVWTLSAAAVVAVAFLLWPADSSPEAVQPEKSVLSSCTPAKEAKEAEEVLVATADIQQTTKASPPRKKRPKQQAKTTPQPSLPTLQETPPPDNTQPEEEISPIPIEKQALADIYLAEVALQVAYKQQAQAEAARAYAASITGEEREKPIIAF